MRVVPLRRPKGKVDCVVCKKRRRILEERELARCGKNEGGGVGGNGGKAVGVRFGFGRQDESPAGNIDLHKLLRKSLCNGTLS